ncbi:MAG: NYN domain-containing protein [Candidatus Paceibacterota bacterium]
MGKNTAYIDGQNLFLGTTKHPDTPWTVDLSRLRVYLRDKYQVAEAYYYIGYVSPEHQQLYDEIQRAGFILRFRKHNSDMLSLKKGNVDTDIVFDVMQGLYKNTFQGGVVLVSGDGDYYRLVELLQTEGKLVKVLFPNAKRASSLYDKKIRTRYSVDLSDPDIRKKIGRKKKGAT